MDNNEIISKFLEQGKLIVRGLARKTTVSELRKHFQRYGRVSDAFIYGQSRRNRRQFLNGFVVFKYPNDIINVLARNHIIDDRVLQIDRADRFKIFVQGLPYIISEKAVTECFQECGIITKIQFERWNCVITFTSTEAVERAVNLSPILLKGKLVTVKQAPEHPEGAAAPEQPEGAAAPEHPEGAAAPEHPEGAAAPEHPEGAAALENPGAAAPEHPEGAAAPENPEGAAAPEHPEGAAAPEHPGAAAPEHPEGAAAVSFLLSLILFVKERIQDILNWCRLRVAGHRPLPPWRIWMLREETRFMPRMNDDPATQARHVKLARAAFARATKRDNEIEGDDDHDDDIRVVPHDYLPPADNFLQEKFNAVYDELDLEKWD